MRRPTQGAGQPRRPGAEDRDHLGALDGWRGISILLVLAAHLLPLGPKSWQLNAMAGPMGMALFFILSGFLITRFLLQRSSVIDFLIRRFFRIVPLAWVAMAVALAASHAPSSTAWAHFFFYANLPPVQLTEMGAHLWSLCVEMQFYVGIALLVAALGRRGLYLLPLLCLAVTLHRVATGALVDIVTWRRVDEILAGSILALVFAGRFGGGPRRLLAALNPYVLLPLFALASHPEGGFMDYLRPYIAALLVGCTLYRAPPRAAALLDSAPLRYLATVSFALYVIHHLLIYTWLGDGERLEKYLTRPLLLAITFALAHWSTFHYERPCIAAGKRLAARLGRGQ